MAETRELYIKNKSNEISEERYMGIKTKKRSVDLWLFSAVAAVLALIFALSVFLVGSVTLSGDLSLDSLGAFFTEKAVMFGFGVPSGGGFAAVTDDGRDEETSAFDEDETENESENGESRTETSEDGIFEDEGGDVTEGSSEETSETVTEERSEGMTEEESGFSKNDGTSTDGEKNENGTEDESSTEEIRLPIVSADLSQAEKGIFYVVNNTAQKTDAKKLAAKELDTGYSENSPYPLVLVLHTHTGESYSQSSEFFTPEKGGLYGVVGVGESLVRVLNENGIVSVHCTVINDGESNIDSYSRAAETIETMLEMYPTVKYIIDLHRSSLTDGDGNIVRTLCRVGEIDTAQIGITVGMGGEWEDNLSLALKIRRFLGLEDAYLSSPVTLCANKFNSEMSRYYLTVDVGSCGNSFAESQRAAEFLGIALARVIKG